MYSQKAKIDQLHVNGASAVVHRLSGSCSAVMQWAALTKTSAEEPAGILEVSSIVATDCSFRVTSCPFQKSDVTIRLQVEGDEREHVHSSLFMRPHIREKKMQMRFYATGRVEDARMSR